MREEVLQKVEETLQELAQLASSGSLLVVEGRRDVEALTRLGITGRFFVLMNGSSMIENMDALAREEDVVVLVDFDRRGRELAAYCRKHLGGRKSPHLNLDVWKKLRGLLGRHVRDVESLAAYLESERKP